MSILDPSLAGMTWGHSIATVVIDATDQQGIGFGACDRVIVALVVELGLHRVKEITIKDGGLLAGERAYEIWTLHGCVHGQADQHWLTAEREILTASTATLPGKPAPQTKRRLPARSKITKTLARAS